MYRVKSGVRFASTERNTRNTIVSRAASPPRNFRTRTHSRTCHTDALTSPAHDRTPHQRRCAARTYKVRRTGTGCTRAHQLSTRNIEVRATPLMSVTHLHSPLPLRAFFLSLSLFPVAARRIYINIRGGGGGQRSTVWRC